ncbi:MAG: hypothetical protein ACFCVH_05530 [Alphaproteobacteria bacterium]
MSDSQWKAAMRNVPMLAMLYLALAGSLVPAFAAAEQFVKEDGSYRTVEDALEGPRLVQVRALFDSWNAGTVRFPDKATLEPFVLAFREPLNCPGQQPRYEMRNVSLDSWGRLPETLTPELPLDTGAQLFLLGLVEGNLPTLGPLDSNQFANQLQRGAFLVLGTAQQLAKDAGASQIRTGYVWSAMQAYPFMIDPFNPAICPTDPTRVLPAPE